jgi:hypothetical protein
MVPVTSVAGIPMILFLYVWGEVVIWRVVVVHHGRIGCFRFDQLKVAWRAFTSISFIDTMYMLIYDERARLRPVFGFV